MHLERPLKSKALGLQLASEVYCKILRWDLALHLIIATLSKCKASSKGETRTYRRRNETRENKTKQDLTMEQAHKLHITSQLGIIGFYCRKYDTIIDGFARQPRTSEKLKSSKVTT
jgi:hypothetical protein